MTSMGILVARIFPDGYRVTYRHDAGMLRSVDDATGVLVSFGEIDALGRPGIMRYGNGLAARYVYAGADPAWCAEVEFRVCGIDLLDEARNISVWSSRQKLNHSRNVELRVDTDLGQATFEYDERGRLTSARSKLFDETYQYDNADNVHPSNMSLAYSEDGNRLSSVGASMVAYDAGGRVTRTPIGDRRTDFGYDAVGRLRMVSDGRGRTDLLFDDEGALSSVRRERHSVDVVDGTSECWEDKCRNLIFVGGALVASVERGESTKLYYHSDELGSIRRVTDKNGRIVGRFAYDPYGRAVLFESARGQGASNGALERTFLGAVSLNHGSVVLLGSRAYAPGYGRFLAPDPLNPGVDVLRRANPYSYGFDNPLTYADPNGQLPIVVVVLIAGAIAGGVDAAIHEQNILEGAIRGAAFATAGYLVGYAGAAAGSALGVNVYVSAGIAQGLYGGIRETAQGGDFGQGFGKGALSGLVGAGIGRGLMEVVPMPESETFGGALSRQLVRDASRGAAQSVIVAAILGEEDPGSFALQGAFYAAGYSALQTATYFAVGYSVSKEPPRWISHSYVFKTDVLEGTRAMQLGLVTLMQEDPYAALSNVNPMCIGDTKQEAPWLLLQHEQGHVWQYNILGANFVPAYFTSIIFRATDTNGLVGGKAYSGSDMESMRFGPRSAPSADAVNEAFGP